MDDVPHSYARALGLRAVGRASRRASRTGILLIAAVAGRRGKTLALRLAGVVIVTAILLLLWTFLARSSDPSIVPEPELVWTRFTEAVSDGTYLPALMATAEEAVLGWGLAALVALPLGYILGRFRALEDALAPYLAGSQAMPVVAIAPLLVVWVGIGLTPKVIVSALIAFFPILATMASGVRGVPRDLRDTARVFGADWLSMAIHVDIPLAARTIFAGLKVAAALSVTGAVVGEFVSPDQGLGHLILLGSTNFDTPLMFVALLSLIGLGAISYTAVSLVERVVLRWDD
jgi:NitT/TauT family transport system permease protein